MYFTELLPTVTFILKANPATFNGIYFPLSTLGVITWYQCPIHDLVKISRCWQKQGIS